MRKIVSYVMRGCQCSKTKFREWETKPPGGATENVFALSFWSLNFGDAIAITVRCSKRNKSVLVPSPDKLGRHQEGHPAKDKDKTCAKPNEKQWSVVVTPNRTAEGRMVGARGQCSKLKSDMERYKIAQSLLRPALIPTATCKALRGVFLFFVFFTMTCELVSQQFQL